MKTVKAQIINILKTIQGGSAFCSFGSTAQILPGMYIKDYGEVSFPFSTSTYQKLLEFSKQAPYGRGEQTITDTSVRRTQEIDASNISFKNPLWEKTLLNILAKVKADLAIDSKTIQASLYKLLIYKEGDFFLPHKDSEKEKGMFGSLVIALPSKHKGGELVINFDGQSKNISFSEIIENYQMPYAAFYADCEHEIKKVTEGYRLCLVYNLIQTDNSSNIKSPAYSKEVEALSSAFSSTDLKKSDTPNVILLNHQYTPKNFGLDFLKRNDAPQAKAIIEAADKAGYYAKLALLTCYQMGDMEADYDFHDYGYGSSYDTEDLALCEMGDVHEEEILVEHWAEDSLPDLGRFEVDSQNIISQFTLKEDEPIQKEGEGYTGNAGMTMEYWYHYAAVVIWPKAQNTNILKDSSVEVKLKWLSFFVQFSDKASDIKAILSALCKDSFNVNNYWYNSIDFSPIPLAFSVLDDFDFTAQADNQSLLEKAFAGVQPRVWVDFFSKYPELLNTSLTKVAKANKLKKTLHICLVLKELSQSEPLLFDQKGMAELIKMPKHLHSDHIYKSASRTDIRNLVSNLVYLSSYYEHEHWFTDLLRSITEHELANRDYVNKVLVDVLLKLENVNNKFAIKLAGFCIKDLKLRIANKPTPPENWSRQVPQSSSYKKQWSILKDFIESPVQQVFDYAIRQAEREIMENAIDSVVIDLNYVTIKKGSPHTLRITKTQNAFEKKLKEWHQDLELLQQLKIKFSHII